MYMYIHVCMYSLPLPFLSAQSALEEARLKKGGALTEAEIKEVIAQVNEQVKQERLSK